MISGDDGTGGCLGGWGIAIRRGECSNKEPALAPLGWVVKGGWERWRRRKGHRPTTVGEVTRRAGIKNGDAGARGGIVEMFAYPDACEGVNVAGVLSKCVRS